MVRQICVVVFVLTLAAVAGWADSADKRNNISDRPQVTVGARDADVIGSDNRAIQLAVDTLAFRGGGTVRVLPGEYTLIDSIHLRSNVNLTGDRDKTVLKRCAAVSSRLLKDADIGQREITPRQPGLFKTGMGVICRSKKARSMSTMPLTVTRIENGVLYVNGYIEDDYIAEEDSWGQAGHDGEVVNVFPLIRGYEVENVMVDGFTLDSGADDNEGSDGLYLRRSKWCTIKNVKAINCKNDGIRFGTNEHITVEDCEAAYNGNYGIHPGAHSPWTIVRRCNIHHNDSDGLYICWGVREGEFTDNTIHHNGQRKHRSGISIGHKDTDNLIARNHIYENSKHGICFRRKTEANGAHRNIVRDNLIENNGIVESQIPGFLKDLPRHTLTGCGVYICGVTHDLVFENNVIRETRRGQDRHQLHAFYIEQGVSRVKMAGNTISGHPRDPIVDKSGCLDNRSDPPRTPEQQAFIKNFLFIDKNDPGLSVLKDKYKLEQVTASGQDELSKLILLNQWTYQQFRKFGKPTYKTENALEILEKIKQGHTFYCAHYTIVFVGAANALGWDARPVSLRRADETERSSNHNVAEVWSRQYGKWVMFDPTLNHYVAKDAVPLNCYEIGAEWVKNNGKDMKFVVGTGRKMYERKDLPVVLAYHKGFGNLAIKVAWTDPYACLAFIPTNRLLGSFPDKSIEKWDDWDNIHFILNGGDRWQEDAEMLPPYYRP
ncbi:MAG TPA: right-handed parallel beta-helix repeat-containing protein [Sedimentisphaerales bacterium]|nr:right-handed parallel beta-helix repeat-containing protein [Sedimentisphaerales bacterium]